MNTTFRALLAEYMENLTLYVPIVKRVHGPTHPEFNDVFTQFEILRKKLDSDTYNLTPEFTKLRTITNNYEVPSDVCETYSAVYEMLAKLDQAYKAE